MNSRYIPIECKEFPSWFEIPGFSRYCANAKGHILNKKTKNFSTGGRAGRYLKVSAYADGKDRAGLYYVHVLVCRAFHGLGELGQVVMHKDNNRSNNKPMNLKWGSQSDNIIQVYRDGLKFSHKYAYVGESLPSYLQWPGISTSTEDTRDCVLVNHYAISLLDYSYNSKELEIEFKDGQILQYNNISKETFEEFATSDSIHHYYHHNIKNVYKIHTVF